MGVVVLVILKILNFKPEVNCNEYAAGEWLKWKGLGLRGDDLTDIFVEAYWDCSNPDWWLDY